MITDIKKKLICADCLEHTESLLLIAIERKEEELHTANKKLAKATAEEKDLYFNQVDEIIQSIKSYKSIIKYLANMPI